MGHRVGTWIMFLSTECGGSSCSLREPTQPFSSNHSASRRQTSRSSVGDCKAHLLEAIHWRRPEDLSAEAFDVKLSPLLPSDKESKGTPPPPFPTCCLNCADRLLHDRVKYNHGLSTYMSGSNGSLALVILYLLFIVPPI